MSWSYSNPHFAEVMQGGAPVSYAEVVVIGFHGKGGGASGIFNKMQKAAAGTDDVAFLAPKSADTVWFGDEFVSAGHDELQTSLAAVADLVASLNAAGVSNDQIVLVGQSQGAVLVNEYLANTGDDFRGAVSWSGALVGPIYEAVMAGKINPFFPGDLMGLEFDRIPGEYAGADLTGQTIQMAVHDADPKVPLGAVLATADYYRSQGAHVEMHVEPGKAHNITEYDVLKLYDTITYDRDVATFDAEDLAGGGFVTVTAESHRSDPDDARILVKIHNANGYSMSGDEFAIATTGGAIEALDLAVLDNGNLALVHVGADNVLMVDIRDADGGAVASHVVGANVDPQSVAVNAAGSGFEIQFSSTHGNTNKETFDTAGEPMDVILAGTSNRDTIFGTEDSDEMFGYRASDILEGRGGDDVLRGGNGRDTLAGGSGDDKLVGQAGHDVLNGGEGTNKLVGGAGADTYVFDTDGADNRIVGFQSGTDTIEIDSALAGSFEEIAVETLRSGDDLLSFADVEIRIEGGYGEGDILFV